MILNEIRTVGFNYIISTLCFAIYVTSTHAHSGNLANNKIDNLVQNYVDNRVFSGSVLVAKNGEVVFHKGFGQANESWDVNNTRDTKFGIGSVSKTIVAVRAMQLVEEGKLKLDDTITQYLPNYPQDKGKLITIHHLLSHRSGLPNYFAIPGWTTGNFNKSMSLQNFEQVLNALPLSFTPGSKEMYSNSGYFLLGRIIETVSKESYQYTLQRNIFAPAKMESTDIHFSESVVKKMATSYQFGKRGGYRESVINRDLFRATGDLYSTTLDLFKFEQALYDNTLLSDQSKKILFSPSNSYSWNQNQVEFGGKKIDIHSYSGQLMGYTSMVTRFPESKSSILLLSNIGTSYAERARLTQQIANIMFGVENENTHERLSSVLHRALYENRFNEFLKELEITKGAYQYDISGLESLAQQLLWSGNKEDSEKISELVLSYKNDR